MLLVRDEDSMRYEKIRAQQHVGIVQADIRNTQLGILDFLSVAYLEARKWRDVFLGHPAADSPGVPRSNYTRRVRFDARAFGCLEREHRRKGAGIEFDANLLVIDVGNANGMRAHRLDAINWDRRISLARRQPIRQESMIAVFRVKQANRACTQVIFDVELFQKILAEQSRVTDIAAAH